MTEWPASIPFFDLRSGYSAQPGENTIRTSVDVGPAKVRRRTTAAPSRVTAMAYMTREEAQRFEMFYRDTLLDGALSFTKTDGQWKRRNLLVQSEAFDQWGKDGAGVASQPVVTANVAASPFGDMTADRVQFNLNGGTDVNDRSRLTQAGALGTTFSIWARSFDGANYSLRLRNGSASIITVTPAWQRFSVSNLSAVDTSLAVGLRGALATSDTADVLLWGAQLEYGTTASEYEPVGASYPATHVTRGGLKTYRIVGVPDFGLMGRGHGIPVTLEVLP